ncbi:hypothetical protein HG536_0D04550 [Torulaspora globosa]|uniref:Uncharacterized protein n=1 Tax=Torulaspora globosa TaxID=48254 RepID=A0A7G3ZHE7_9SACH|nr:uncharacterized protein HG536_0D04550 [Torulaspora globosa]QLL32933.1 hypothetical protein HG536_0D04550 [Torulaspora globosa]
MTADAVAVASGTEVVTEEGVESDDFGSFSDASFTSDLEEDYEGVTRYLDDLLPNCGYLAPSDSQPAALEQLLQDERPHVIYEQLVELRTALQPLSWDKSHLKANLWHILRIPEGEPAEKQPLREVSLDDSLYKQLMSLLKDNNVHATHLLRDQLKINYTSPLTPLAARAEEEKEQEGTIRSLLAKTVDSSDDLTEYHDALCREIDILLVELRQLNDRQAALMTDKSTFESVITNLTGHTQRLYRDEVALYNKRIKKKSRFRWLNKV